MTKRIICIGIILVMAFSLSGCFETGYRKYEECDSLEEVQALVPFLYYFDLDTNVFSLISIQVSAHHTKRGSKIVKSEYLGYYLVYEFSIEGESFRCVIAARSEISEPRPDLDLDNYEYQKILRRDDCLADFFFDGIRLAVYEKTEVYFHFEGYTYNFIIGRVISDEFTLDDLKAELESIILSRYKVV